MFVDHYECVGHTDDVKAMLDDLKRMESSLLDRHVALKQVNPVQAEVLDVMFGYVARAITAGDKFITDGGVKS